MATKPNTNPAPLRYVSTNEIKGAEYVATSYRLAPVRPMTIEDLLQPRSWAHVSNMLRIGDLVEVMAEDARWYAKLIVRHIDEPEVFVGVVEHVVFDTPLPAKKVAA